MSLMLDNSPQENLKHISSARFFVCFLQNYVEILNTITRIQGWLKLFQVSTIIFRNYIQSELSVSKCHVDYPV